MTTSSEACVVPLSTGSCRVATRLSVDTNLHGSDRRPLTADDDRRGEHSARHDFCRNIDRIDPRVTERPNGERQHGHRDLLRSQACDRGAGVSSGLAPVREQHESGNVSRRQLRPGGRERRFEVRAASIEAALDPFLDPRQASKRTGVVERQRLRCKCDDPMVIRTQLPIELVDRAGRALDCGAGDAVRDVNDVDDGFTR